MSNIEYVIPNEALPGEKVSISVNVESLEKGKKYKLMWSADKGRVENPEQANTILHIDEDLEPGEHCTVICTVQIASEPEIIGHQEIKITERPIPAKDIKEAIASAKGFFDEIKKKLPSDEAIKTAVQDVKGIFEGIRDRLPSEDRPFSVKLNPTKQRPTKNLILNAIIRHGSKSAFKEFKDKLNEKIDDNLETHLFHSTNAYQKLVKLTDDFLQENTPTLYDMFNLDNPNEMFNLVKDDDKLKKELSQDEIRKSVEEYFKKTPFLRAKARELEEDNVIMERFAEPILRELIWSYWLEEGMLVQTMNAISLRFQNKSLSSGRDPLKHLDIDSLRPLGNLIWGYIQDEQHRLTVQRRAYEYDHHYGLRLYGKAVPTLQSADSRSKFLEAFHHLLYRSTIFFKEHDDMTVNADAFPLLNAIKELHLILAEGMHNQYGDLPWTARREMLLQQFILSRPEMKEFLRGRIMMPYEEDWMGAVDTMKKLQGWSDVSVTHFRNLAVWGEQILLSIRHDTWNDSTRGAAEAANWAVDWRDAIQGYIHAYRAVAGVDLTTEPVDSTPTFVHLQARLQEQKRRLVRA